MKIRYLLICFTIVMFSILFFLMEPFYKEQFRNRDMVFYNEQIKLVEQALQQGTGRSEAEEEYQCEILFREDENYESRLNELLQDGAVIIDYQDDGEIVGKVAWNEGRLFFQETKSRLSFQVSVIWLAVLLCGDLLFFLIYVYVMRPFQKLQRFCAQIAKGILDFPLPIQKHNFFGAFTESFDIMREELKKAQEGEYQANRSKKELVAELSHDIKTPISTIKATCEVMQVKEQNPDTLDKVAVIAAKAEMVDRLIENMFHATLEELEVLKVEATEESSLCIEEMLRELRYYGEIAFSNRMPECLVWIDQIRLQQVVDNIINNTYKYAGTIIHVSFEEQKEGIKIRIRDEGTGVPEEELALITEKFYRGTNALGKAGSGLGLYLSRMFMEQMQGGMDCYNQDGFVVELFVRKV